MLSSMRRIKPTKIFFAIIILSLTSLLLLISKINLSLFIINSKNDQFTYDDIIVGATLGHQQGRELDINDGNKNNYKINYLRTGKKPWFMTNGTQLPVHYYSDGINNFSSSSLAIWPDESSSDRIVNQLMYLPIGYPLKKEQRRNMKLKKILLYFGNSWQLPGGQTKFVQDNCPIDTCSLSFAKGDASESDAILFYGTFPNEKIKRSSNQVWILYLLESPFNTHSFNNLPAGIFNWTATYRHDSDIVAPYEKFVSFGDDYYHFKQTSTKPENLSKGKNKKVAWFVSNCSTKNKRLHYAKQLARYIQVDIYGSCGDKRCSRLNSNHCFEILDKYYKFYLAFENTNCRDYITEKLFVNGLGLNNKNHNLIPIVMGAHPNDYALTAPTQSYIHVDDFASPKHLADFLHRIDQDDNLFNEYLKWKQTGEFINTYFWCRLCTMLHAPPKPKSYQNINAWWNPPGVCKISGSWLKN